MASTDQVLNQISQGLTGLESDVNRLISKLGELTPEQQAAADSILARLGKLNEQADTAVPETGAETTSTTTEGLQGGIEETRRLRAEADAATPQAGEDSAPAVDVLESDVEGDDPRPTASNEDA